jgi:hypothetical protein
MKLPMVSPGQKGIKMAKATDAEIEDRLKAVTQLVLQAISHQEIVDYCRRNFGVERAQTCIYLKRVKERMIEANKKTTEELLAEANSRYDDIYKKEYGNDNWAGCRETLKCKDKINGLQVNRIRFTDETEIDEKSIDERIEKLLKLQQKQDG